MIRIEPGQNRVQWTGAGDKHYVGRVLQDSTGNDVQDAFDHTQRNVLVLLDYDGGHVFVDRNILRPYPDAPIPEPTNTGASR